MNNYERLSQTHLGKSAVIEKKIITQNVATHWHEFYEFEYISNGECEFVINGKSYHGSASDMFIFNLSDFHEIRLISDSLELYTLQFNIEYISDTLLSFLLHNERKKISFKEDKSGTLLHLLDIFVNECEKSLSFHNQYVKSLLNAIVVNICRKLESLSTTSSEALNNPVKLAINYMQLNFQEPITLTDIAKYAKVSPSYMSRMFKMHTGLTLKSYLTSLRLEYSAKMLEFSGLSVTEICFSSGFGDFSNFWRSFTSRYGCSPREYKSEKTSHTDV